jgi:hypothetical protein
MILTNIKTLIISPQTLFEGLNVENHNMDSLNMVNQNLVSLRKLFLSTEHRSMDHPNIQINSMQAQNMFALKEGQLGIQWPNLFLVIVKILFKQTKTNKIKLSIQIFEFLQFRTHQ